MTKRSDTIRLLLSDILPTASARSVSTHDTPQPSPSLRLPSVFFSTTHPSLAGLVFHPPIPSPFSRPPSTMRSPLYLAAAVVPALAAIKDVYWDITYVQNVNPDGLFERRAIGVNGTWPYVALSIAAFFTYLTFLIPCQDHHRLRLPRPITFEYTRLTNSTGQQPCTTMACSSTQPRGMMELQV